MPLYLLIILLFFLPLLSSCAATGNATTSDAYTSSVSTDGKARALYLFSRARLATNDGDFPTALNLLRDAIEKDPTSAFLHTAVADLKLKIGQVPEALEYINKAIELDPDYREPYVIAGIVMVSAGKDAEAAKYLRKAIKLDPSKEDAYIHLSTSLIRVFEYEEAVTTLKELVKLNSDSVLGYYYLGRTYSQMKLYREAIVYFKKVLELRPDFGQAAIDMAASHEALGEYSTAIDIYRSLLKEEDNRGALLQRLIQLLIQQRRFEEALSYLNISAKSGMGGQETQRKIGLIHLELEQYDAAIKVFTEILEKDPSADAIRLYLGVAFEEKEELERAYEEFSKIVSGSPVYTEAIGHRAFILRSQGNNKAAEALLKEAIAIYPNQIDLYLNLSSLYEALEKPVEALVLLQDNEKRFSSEPKLHFRLGVLYDKLGKKPESIERMKKVLALNPNEAQALNFLGYTYAEMGIHLNEALTYLKKAIELRPKDGFIMDSLGWLYFKMNKYDDAVTYLEEANRLVQEDSTIAEHLGDAYYAKRELKKALKLYKRALELSPEQKELAEKIRKLKGEQVER